MDTPLAIKTYFFPHVSVSADPLYVKTETEPPLNCDIKVLVERDDATDIYQVTVEIVSEPESEDKRQPYSLHLIGVGIFTVNPEWPNPEKLLRINGASMIFSAAREFLITITSRGPWKSICLPTISLLKHYEEQFPPAKDDKLPTPSHEAKP